MQILQLVTENYRRIKAVQIDADQDGVIVVSGRNAQGKTSVLDSILAALGTIGKEITMPIREGEDRARVRVDLGELIVERTWRGGHSQLKVTTAAGAQINGPAKVLATLVGKLAFDPLAFAQARPADQVRALTEVLDLDVDLDALERQRRTAYDDRTAANREVRALEARLNALRVPEQGLPASEVSVPSLAADYQAAVTRERRLDELKARREQLRVQIAETQQLLERLRANLEEVQLRGAELAQEVRASRPAEDIKALMEEADETNRKVREAAQWHAIRKELEHARSHSEALTSQIESVDRDRREALERAGMPYPGLEFTTDGVTLNGIPFAQASGAERLRASVGVAMAANPNLRVIRIVDGSLLDSDGMAYLRQVAAKNEYQIWIERVADHPDGVGIYIEDGEVA